jgi:RNA polymerase sigma factor (sigma-70 family)
MGFKRIVEEKKQEIADLRKYGVPRSCAVTEYVHKGGMPSGIVLEEESVESAVASVERSVQGTVQVISLIDKCMAALKYDQYYSILEMRYFEGRTQEDIAATLGCNQATVARNKSRLVKELSMRLFPDQVADEMMN